MLNNDLKKRPTLRVAPKASKETDGVSRIAVSPRRAAKMYDLDEGTLANWRCKRLGPKFYKIGTRKVIYYLDDLEIWAKSGPVLTSDSIKGEL